MLFVVLPQLVFGVNSITRQRIMARGKCGNPVSDLQSRISRGDDFERSDLPWMVALSRNYRNQAPVFFCAGTLVSSRHVITGNVPSQILRVLVIRIFNILLGLL